MRLKKKNEIEEKIWDWRDHCRLVCTRPSARFLRLCPVPPPCLLPRSLSHSTITFSLLSLPCWQVILFGGTLACNNKTSQSMGSNEDPPDERQIWLQNIRFRNFASSYNAKRNPSRNSYLTKKGMDSFWFCFHKTRWISIDRNEFLS